MLELALCEREERPFAGRWLSKLRAGDVGLQVCAVYSADRPDPPAYARRLLDCFDRAVEETGDDVFAIRTRADLNEIGGPRIGLALSLEGVEPLGGDPSFDEWWERGIRMVGLTHNPANAFAGGIDEPELGLTDLGRELVAELERRRIVIDLAHASERTFDEVLERAPDARVIVSHAACAAVHAHPRNIDDARLRAIAERGGVLGLMALRLVVGGAADVERLADHAEHAVEVMGIEHVALGTDVIDQVLQAEIAAGIPQLPMTSEALREGGGVLGLRGFTGPEDFPALVDTLRRRGFDGDDLDAITHLNLLRVLRDALP